MLTKPELKLTKSLVNQLEKLPQELNPLQDLLTTLKEIIRRNNG